MKKIALGIVAGLVALALVSGCTEGTSKQYNAIDKKAQKRVAYNPINDVEFNNYNKAQKLYDSPDSIQWCTTTWGNANAPLVTIPIAGKLTSSSVSYFPNKGDKDGDGYTGLVELRSVDGMFHGTPPKYRYGFTPGDQYVDFYGMPTLCTTALTKFQREKTQVSVTNASVDDAQRKAEAALKSGDNKGAENALKDLESK